MTDIENVHMKDILNLKVTLMSKYLRRTTSNFK